MDKMTLNGKSYELRKMTLEVVGRIEEAKLARTEVEAAERIYDLLNYVLGENVVADILGTTELEEADTVTIALMFRAMERGYKKRVDDLEKKYEAEDVARPYVKVINQVSDNVEKIKSLNDD